MEEKRITVTEEQKIQLEENYREALLALESIGRILGELKVTVTLKDDAIFFETEERVRKVWVVEIEYNVENYSSLSGFTYYIDATTGEVIGGELGIYILDKEESLYNDPHNVIEK